MFGAQQVANHRHCHASHVALYGILGRAHGFHMIGQDWAGVPQGLGDIVVRPHRAQPLDAGGRSTRRPIIEVGARRDGHRRPCDGAYESDRASSERWGTSGHHYLLDEGRAVGAAAPRGHGGTDRGKDQ
ncbi:hypothetical protein ACFY9A_10645 [Streptomyces rubradiris]|uniref:hypothetical protein n=1 Tax=Streptomyces rubradiris TaxID=285531 RepID=UPI0036E4F897